MKPKNRIASLMDGVKKREDDQMAEHRKKAAEYEAEIAAMPLRDDVIQQWNDAQATAATMLLDPKTAMQLTASFVCNIAMECASTNDPIYGARLLTLCVAHMQACGLNIREARDIIQQNMEHARKFRKTL